MRRRKKKQKKRRLWLISAEDVSECHLPYEVMWVNCERGSPI